MGNKLLQPRSWGGELISNITEGQEMMRDIEHLGENIRDEYFRIASHYDRIIGPLVMPVRRGVCRVVLKHGFKKILDICCGTGSQCIMLRSLGFSVAGVDLSPAMLGVARQNSRGQIPFHAADAANLPFPDDSFDCAILSFALHEKEEISRHRILAEAKRVLDPGGRIVFVDFEAPIGLLSRAAGGFVHLVERCAGKRHYANFLNYMRMGALRGLLRVQGLLPTHERLYHFSNVALVVAAVSSNHLNCSSLGDFT